MVYQPLTKERFDEIVDECFRAVDHAFEPERRYIYLSEVAHYPDPNDLLGTEHGAHGVLEEESEIEMERRTR